MSEVEEKVGDHHFEASQVAPSFVNHEPATEIYHEDGALTVNMRDAHVETGARSDVKLAKDGCVSCSPEPIPIMDMSLLTKILLKSPDSTDPSTVG